jgi:hypothetical protein
VRLTTEQFLDALATELGGRPWVIARRTKRIVTKYGEDVVCVTLKRYHEALKKVDPERYGREHDT